MNAPVVLSRFQGDKLETVPRGYRLVFSVLTSTYYLMPKWSVQ